MSKAALLSGTRMPSYVKGFIQRERIELDGDYRDQFKAGARVHSKPGFDFLTRDFRVIEVGTHKMILEAIDG